MRLSGVRKSAPLLLFVYVMACASDRQILPCCPRTNYFSENQSGAVRNAAAAGNGVGMALFVPAAVVGFIVGIPLSPFFPGNGYETSSPMMLAAYFDAPGPIILSSIIGSITWLTFGWWGPKSDPHEGYSPATPQHADQTTSSTQIPAGP